jgi:hypothetical protein
MELFNKSFNMKCELEQLKAQLRKWGIIIYGRSLYS